MSATGKRSKAGMAIQTRWSKYSEWIGLPALTDAYTFHLRPRILPLYIVPSQHSILQLTLSTRNSLDKRVLAGLAASALWNVEGMLHIIIHVEYTVYVLRHPTSVSSKLTHVP